MTPKCMIVPNAVVLACAILLFHRAILSGHITWIGSLVILSPSLALAYCLMPCPPRCLAYAAAILNAVLFFNCCYALVGLARMLLKTGMLGGMPVLMLGAMWASAFGTALAGREKAHRAGAISLNLVFCALGALGLYVRAASAWTPWMTAVLFGALITASALNVCALLRLFAFKIRDRTA